MVWKLHCRLVGLAPRGGYCHDRDTRSTLYHSIQLCPRICCPFHCMYLCFPIVSTLLVSPLIGEHSVRSASLYDYLICFHLRSPVILCSHPILLTNTICLGELVTYITGLTHRAVRLRSPLFVGIPDPLSIAPYILLSYINLRTPSVVASVQILNKILHSSYLCPILRSTLVCTCTKSSDLDRIISDSLS